MSVIGRRNGWVLRNIVSRLVRRLEDRTSNIEHPLSSERKTLVAAEIQVYHGVGNCWSFCNACDATDDRNFVLHGDCLSLLQRVSCCQGGGAERFGADAGGAVE